MWSAVAKYRGFVVKTVQPFNRFARRLNPNITIFAHALPFVSKSACMAELQQSAQELLFDNASKLSPMEGKMRSFLSYYKCNEISTDITVLHEAIKLLFGDEIANRDNTKMFLICVDYVLKGHFFYNMIKDKESKSLITAILCLYLAIKKKEINYLCKGNLNKMYLLAGDIYHTRAYYLSTAYCPFQYYHCLSSIEEMLSSNMLNANQHRQSNISSLHYCAEGMSELYAMCVELISKVNSTKHDASKLSKIGKELGYVSFFNQLLISKCVKVLG